MTALLLFLIGVKPTFIQMTWRPTILSDSQKMTCEKMHPFLKHQFHWAPWELQAIAEILHSLVQNRQFSQSLLKSKLLEWKKKIIIITCPKIIKTNLQYCPCLRPQWIWTAYDTWRVCYFMTEIIWHKSSPKDRWNTFRGLVLKFTKSTSFFYI